MEDIVLIIFRRITKAIALKKNRRALTKALAAATSLRKNAELKGNQDVSQIANLFQLVLLFNYDVHLLMPGLFWSRHDWQRRFYGRLLALTAVEGFEDFSRIFGNQFRKTITSKEMLRDLDEIMKRFGNIRKRHEAFLRSVRNHTIAHKDHDAKRQLEWIESLDLTHMCELCNEIVNWLTSMHWFLIQFTQDVEIQLEAAD